MSALPRGVCPPGGQNNLLIVVDSCLIRPAFALTLSCNAQHRKKRRKKASGANRERLLWERPICSLAHDDLSRSSMENLFNQHFDGNRQSVWLNEVLIWGVLTFCHFCYMELFVVTSHTDQHMFWLWPYVRQWRIFCLSRISLWQTCGHTCKALIPVAKDCCGQIGPTVYPDMNDTKKLTVEGNVSGEV